MLRPLSLAVTLAVALALGVAAAGGTVTDRVIARPDPASPQPAPPPKPRPAVAVVVSKFTTRYEPGQPRVTNIRRAAELLDGTVLAPGETFSMNEALGERTTARGFVPAPMISAGRLVDSVGGGISQAATALYNAAFFAGLELIAHTPHSFYIDRYPMGREATVSWGGPELIFRNDWQAPLRMSLRATDTALTVTFYSARLGRRVETTTGEPFAEVRPATQVIANPALAAGEEVVIQEAGAPGFSVEYSRRVYRYGTLVRHERFRTDYRPKNAIVEVGPRRLGQP